MIEALTVRFLTDAGLFESKHGSGSQSSGSNSPESGDFGLDIVTAVAVSLFVMVPTALIGSITGWFQGMLHFELAIPLFLGIVVGAQIGPRIGARVPKVRLRQLFGVVLLYAAVNMLLKGIQGIT